MLLLKLHGSLNWYWTPDDPSGTSVARRMLPGRYRAPEKYEEADRRRELPGRVPFVVPPTATKNRYYSNPIVRELWRTAAGALHEADRIVFMGYSLPMTDLTFNAMLNNALRSEPQTMLVADIDGGAVAGRLERLGVPPEYIEVVPDEGDGPIAVYVLRWCREVALRAAEDLRDRSAALREHPMFVSWGITESGVTGATLVNNTVILTIEDPSQNATRWRSQDAVLPTLDDVLRLLPADGALVVKTAQEEVQDIIAWSEYRTDLGYGHGIWTVLTPSGPPPTQASEGMPTSDIQ